MNCKQALELMLETLESRRMDRLAPSLREHLDACPACRERWRQLVKVEALARQTAAGTAAPASLHGGIMARLDREPVYTPGISGRRAGRGAVAFALAAAAVLATLMLTSRPADPVREVGQPPVAQLGPGRELALPSIESLPLPREISEAPRLIADAGSSLSTMGRTFLSNTESAVRAVSPTPIAAEENPVEKE